MVTYMVTRGERMAKTMRASDFKARCLKAMDEVASSGEPIVITKRGKPVAQLAPIAAKPKTLRGFLKSHVKSIGNIVEPVGVPWNAERS
jgi:prevent-host-death family protein